MLVLTRRIGEEIVIGDHVRVRVVAVHGDRIRVAILAPEQIRVDRLEVHERRMNLTKEQTKSKEAAGLGVPEMNEPLGEPVQMVP